MTKPKDESDTEELIGRVVAGRYRVLSLLGEGGMGAIFVAEHLALHKQVALKVVRPKHAGNEAAAARFAREAMVTATIDHPNVISAIDYGSMDGGGAFLAMQLVQGGTLTQLLQVEHTLHWARAASLGAQVADAVMAAGTHGIVHRDLKPDNVLIQPNQDGTDLVKVLDFGIAKFSRDSLAPPAARGAQAVTQTGMVVGTPGYMSPEQALGEPTDHRSDLYSLGVLLWECIVGRRLWSGSSVRGIVRRQLKDHAPRLSEAAADPTVPEPLDELIALLTSRDAEHRPHGIQDVRDLLREVADSGQGGGGRLDPALSSLSQRMQRIRAQCPAEELATGTPSGVPEATPMTGGGEPQVARARRRPYALWGALFGVSLVVGVGLGLRGRGSPEARMDPHVEVSSTSEQAADAPLSRPSPEVPRATAHVGATGLPSALQPHLATLVRAEGRTERVAAAEALLGHMPVGDVPNYARLVAHLQLADTCPKKREIVEKLASLSDPRALPALVMVSQRAKAGCGANNRDCLACMREHLHATISTLENRQQRRGNNTR